MRTPHSRREVLTRKAPLSPASSLLLRKWIIIPLLFVPYRTEVVCCMKRPTALLFPSLVPTQLFCSYTTISYERTHCVCMVADPVCGQIIVKWDFSCLRLLLKVESLASRVSRCSLLIHHAQAESIFLRRFPSEP